MRNVTITTLLWNMMHNMNNTVLKCRIVVLNYGSVLLSNKKQNHLYLCSKYIHYISHVPNIVRYITLVPSHAGSQNFAEEGGGLMQKFKPFCSKNAPVKWGIEQTSANLAHHRMGSGGKVPGH